MIVYRNPAVHALSIAYNRLCNAQNRRLNHPDLFKRHVWRAEDAIAARSGEAATTDRQWEILRALVEFHHFGDDDIPTLVGCTPEDWRGLVELFVTD